MKNVTILDHPLVKHKLSILRQRDTGTNEFRQIVAEIARLMAYEATRNLELETYAIETPLERTTGYRIAGKKLAIIPILRAGLGMVDAFLDIVPTAKVGHIGLYRDPESFKPVEYYLKLPKDISDREIYVLDPMLATGGSMIATVDCLKKKGCKNIHAVDIIAAPEGLEAMQKAHPDVDITIAGLDRTLNEQRYILPGLGDAGDRLFGTK